MLAFRIESVSSKAHILELYLNEIYLGGGSGVARASLFRQGADQLTIPEAAFLAAPQGAEQHNPVRFPMPPGPGATG